MRRRLPTIIREAAERAEAIDTRPYARGLDFLFRFPLSVNHTYRLFALNGRARMAKTKEAKEYEESVGREVAAHLAQLGWRPPLPPYGVAIRAYPPADGRKHDLDNLLKLTIDSVFRALGADDDHIIDLRIRKPWRAAKIRHEAGILVTVVGQHTPRDDDEEWVS